jgi:hypothetical protein
MAIVTYNRYERFDGTGSWLGPRAGLDVVDQTGVWPGAQIRNHNAKQEIKGLQVLHNELITVSAGTNSAYIIKNIKMIPTLQVTIAIPLFRVVPEECV